LLDELIKSVFKFILLIDIFSKTLNLKNKAGTFKQYVVESN